MTIGMESRAIARRHKGQGIASFVIGTLSVPVMIGLIGLAALVQVKTGKVTQEVALLLGFGLMTVVFIDLVGIGLGVFGAVDRASKKTFPALGIVLNVATVALFAALAVIGLMAKGH